VNAKYVSAVIALAAGALEPPLEVAWKCRSGFESTEACVWGRSFLPLSRVVGIVLIAPVTFVVLMAVAYFWRRSWNARVPPEANRGL